MLSMMNCRVSVSCLEWRQPSKPPLNRRSNHLTLELKVRGTIARSPNSIVLLNRQPLLKPDWGFEGTAKSSAHTVDRYNTGC